MLKVYATIIMYTLLLSLLIFDIFRTAKSIKNNRYCFVYNWNKIRKEKYIMNRKKEKDDVDYAISMLREKVKGNGWLELQLDIIVNYINMLYKYIMKGYENNESSERKD